MRWLLVLSLAACASFQEWDSESVDSKTLPVLAEALRGASGDANVAAGDRFYQIRGEALQPELQALTSALAYAIEVQGRHPPKSQAVDFADWGRRSSGPRVESFTYPRALSIARGQIRVRATQTDRGTLWWAQTRQRPDHYLFDEVPSTPAIDAAWQNLVEAARKRAGKPAEGFLLWPDIDYGVDIRGIGGPLQNEGGG